MMLEFCSGGALDDLILGKPLISNFFSLKGSEVIWYCVNTESDVLHLNDRLKLLSTAQTTFCFEQYVVLMFTLQQTCCFMSKITL